jgi:hypothetical protein
MHRVITIDIRVLPAENLGTSDSSASVSQLMYRSQTYNFLYSSVRCGLVG